jgi:hypothetical protein
MLVGKYHTARTPYAVLLTVELLHQEIPERVVRNPHSTDHAFNQVDSKEVLVSVNQLPRLQILNKCNKLRLQLDLNWILFQYSKCQNRHKKELVSLLTKPFPTRSLSHGSRRSVPLQPFNKLPVPAAAGTANSCSMLALLGLYKWITRLLIIS